MDFFRHPKTTQERKLYVGLCTDQKELDVRIKLRAARSARNLPNTWDDLYAHPIRSWKEHRKLQYKG